MAKSLRIRSLTIQICLTETDVHPSSSGSFRHWTINGRVDFIDRDLAAYSFVIPSLVLLLPKSLRVIMSFLFKGALQLTKLIFAILELEIRIYTAIPR
jgi:hypothetical protein